MVLDTNILIAYLNGDNAVVHAVNAWNEEGRSLCVSTLAYAETLAYPVLTEKDIVLARDFLQRFIVLPFDETTAERAAQLRRAHRLPLPDAGIIATALVHHLPLVTRDKALHKVPEIECVLL